MGGAEHLEKASYVRTLQTRTADMHDCQLDCQLGSVVQHRRAPDRTLSSHKQSPRYALRRNGAPPGGLPLSLLALSHQKIEEQLIREVARDVELGFGMESSGRAP